jgi:hypothetical protein
MEGGVMCDRAKAADQAFQAHQAVLLMSIQKPSLADNPFWTMLKQDAYERFVLALEKVQ